MLLCQFFVLPGAVKALLKFNEMLGFDPDIRLNEWLGLAIILPLVFGLSFQTPLVMIFLNRIGMFYRPGLPEEVAVCVLRPGVLLGDGHADAGRRHDDVPVRPDVRAVPVRHPVLPPVPRLRPERRLEEEPASEVAV